MKRNVVTLAVIIALGFMGNRSVYAQGYPVIDITNIAASIENGFTMVEQLHSMYNQIKTSYDQLQKQIKSFESFDFRQLNAKDPLGSWRSMMTYADRMMTYEENIESIIKKKNIKIGDGSYSLEDIFMTPGKTTQSMATDGLNFVLVDPFEKKLTAEEKAIFHQKYGMSYGHYMRLNQIGEVLKKKSAEVIGYSDGLQKNLAEDRQRLDHIVEDVFENESTIKQQQINNAVMTIMAQDIKTQANMLGNIANQLAALSSQAQIEKQARQEEINMNDLGIAEGLFKMLDGMPSSTDYR